MNESFDHPQFILPSGDDLRVFLIQDAISASMIRKVLRNRGVFLASTDKKDMLEQLLLSYISPSEFVYLLDELRTRLDSQKLRSRSYTVRVDAPPLVEMLPTNLNFEEIVRDEYGNSRPIGVPQFVFDQKGQSNSCVINYRIERTSFGADWIRSRRIYEGEVRYTHKPENQTLEVTAFHTSDETERANRLLINHVRSDMKKREIIHDGDETIVTFGSLTNAQRIAFFMQFTSFNDISVFSFEKLTDISLRLDDNAQPPDQERLNWMKSSVSKVLLTGELQDTFFVKDISCRPYLIVWKMEAQFKFESPDASGRFSAVFEFADSKMGSSEFQVYILNLTADGKSQRSPDCVHLRKKFSLKLNSAKAEFFKKVMGSITQL
jgi:hypothetical protein